MAPSIRIEPTCHVAPVDPLIFSGFMEHMGRCIYGGVYDDGNEHGSRTSTRMSSRHSRILRFWLCDILEGRLFCLGVFVILIRVHR
ncbi:hypothetical protein C8R44DRAFT_623881 [Mycena epipterygia]|nr:hypothetical protein C8R44DRAFT_623881 [Mycena epipterygia]